MANSDQRLLAAEARVVRQREVVNRLEACGSDVSGAKSILSALRYSLRLLKQQQRRAHRSG
jgi:hypothetical protein